MSAWSPSFIFRLILRYGKIRGEKVLSIIKCELNFQQISADKAKLLEFKPKHLIEPTRKELPEPKWLPRASGHLRSGSWESEYYVHISPPKHDRVQESIGILETPYGEAQVDKLSNSICPEVNLHPSNIEEEL
jgi:hypothetical protein